MHKKFKQVAYIISIISFLGVCSSLGWYFSNYMSKPTIEYSATYPDYSLSELAAIADNIVYGTVDERGATEIEIIDLNSSGKAQHIKDYTEVLQNPKIQNNYVEDLYTNVSIEVITPVKINGSNVLPENELRVDKKMLYKEEGGETEELKIIPDGGVLNIGDHVLIFTNKYGKSWGPQSVLKVSNGIVKDKDGNEHNIRDLISELQNEI
ncbi:hypothetical protein [Paenibacillus sp. QZ-Y1]|uniref:hypothetical protein n=1 Tax=Paenibacillus sp. QZ-Y1 TaxID=3414511 RepID=UPI003F7ABC2E